MRTLLTNQLLLLLCRKCIIVITIHSTSRHLLIKLLWRLYVFKTCAGNHWWSMSWNSWSTTNRTTTSTLSWSIILTPSYYIFLLRLLIILSLIDLKIIELLLKTLWLPHSIVLVRLWICFSHLCLFWNLKSWRRTWYLLVY